ncbi:MAG: carboxypeptidase regulatory-like domain-containing protein, partial [Candidatus Eremiobacteraeota bacterium]|nr:carboxypeptidase regulatory-like domain-containing protein [Candidatus Eremiobacteraeota bacterium]
MTPRLAAAAIALLVSLGTNGRAAAQDIATIRGVVYACEGDAPIPYVGVTLRRLDDGAVLRLATDRWGRFVDVGLAPGRYLVAVGTGGRSVLAPYDFRENQVLEPASRLARIENDDVLDVRLGTR